MPTYNGFLISGIPKYNLRDRNAIDQHGAVLTDHRNGIGVTFDSGGFGIISRPMIIDDWDPNTWSQDHEHRVYGDDRGTVYAIVDEVDYLWAVRWRWNPVKMHGGKRKEKIYLRRAISLYEDHKRVGTQTVLLHVEIMKRTGIIPPSPFHTRVDHRFGNTLDCRRKLMRWATPSMNRYNIDGQNGYDIIEDIACLTPRT